MKGIKQVDLLKPGMKVDCYTVIRKLGSGSFGQVYKAEFVEADGSTIVQCALKVEDTKCKKRILQAENKIMSLLTGCKYFPMIYGCSKVEDRFTYLSMELGEGSLKEFSNRQAKKRLSNEQINYVMRSIVEGLKYIHSCGYVHRDIKSGNIIIMKMKGDPFPPLKIIDCGLSRRYLKENGQLRPKRPDGKVPFRGTKIYASENQLRRKEFTRGDDMINLWYSMVALISKRSFPWNSDTPLRNQIKMRLSYTLKLESNPQIETAFKLFYNLIDHLQYEDQPRYDAIIEIFNSS